MNQFKLISVYTILRKFHIRKL